MSFNMTASTFQPAFPPTPISPSKFGGQTPFSLAPISPLGFGAGAGAGDAKWSALQQALSGGGGGGGMVQGAAAGHAQGAREEAARKLVANHSRVLADLCNRSQHNNIDGSALTQLELMRVQPGCAEHVDQALRETARRLLGAGQPEQLDGSPQAVEARAQAAR